MTREDRQLLLKDLCARSPYGIIINVNGNDERVDKVNPFEGIITCGFQSFDVDECKPYLRSMSSMTEKEYTELKAIAISYGFAQFEYIYDWCWCPNYEATDWLNKNMFDYRELIKMGLAIEAPKGMYNN